ncbi:TraR/DksA family transcriptional regulator [Nocardioides sp. HB32]
MDLDLAKQLLEAERQRLRRLLATTSEAKLDDSAAERAAGDGDVDAAQPLEHEAIDSAIEQSLHERLDAIARAEKRIEDGTYGKSVESGRAIRDDRLAIDPAAELTVAEAARRHRRDR